ncbi:hypothetical protein MsAg5_15650 [Methanosarcinaceae archaeon Ag5]|uniref:Holliday junction resolvase n=1 Tax=Methanolapillus africanus TaxID=3028297 RepID=A0AAE4SFT2_9EURY|nr:hypothetical protein [Methanosarcinaceae archaeon Ag5]
MTEFERDLVHSFNEYFQEKNIRGISYRLKQHRFTSQFLDVLVDSLNPDYYLGIECKSISVEKGTKALYFTQHFTTDKKGVHQIERISDFLKCSGRRGYLAVELRYGAGRAREAYAIPWKDISERFNSESLKFTIEEIASYPSILRGKSDYHVEADVWGVD